MIGRWSLVKVTVFPVRVEEMASVELPRPAPSVWSFLGPPESNVDLFESVELGARIPGVPAGLGELQVVIERHDHGRVGAVTEVVEYEEGRRAVTRSLTEGWSNYGALT